MVCILLNSHHSKNITKIMAFKLQLGALRRHRFCKLSWEHPSRVLAEIQESSQASYLQLLVQTQHACYLTMESAQEQNKEQICCE